MKWTSQVARWRPQAAKWTAQAERWGSQAEKWGAAETGISAGPWAAEVAAAGEVVALQALVLVLEETPVSSLDFQQLPQPGLQQLPKGFGLWSSKQAPMIRGRLMPVPRALASELAPPRLRACLAPRSVVAPGLVAPRLVLRLTGSPGKTATEHTCQIAVAD